MATLLAQVELPPRVLLLLGVGLAAVGEDAALVAVDGPRRRRRRNRCSTASPCPGAAMFLPPAEDLDLGQRQVALAAGQRRCARSGRACPARRLDLASSDFGTPCSSSLTLGIAAPSQRAVGQDRHGIDDIDQRVQVLRRPRPRCGRCLPSRRRSARRRPTWRVIGHAWPSAASFSRRGRMRRQLARPAGPRAGGRGRAAPARDWPWPPLVDAFHGGEQLGQEVGLVDLRQAFEGLLAKLRQDVVARQQRQVHRRRARHLAPARRCETLPSTYAAPAGLFAANGLPLAMRRLPVGLQRRQRFLDAVVEVVVGRMLEGVAGRSRRPWRP